MHSSITVKQFVIENKDLLSELHPRLTKKLESVEIDNSKVFGDIAEYVFGDLNKSCEDFNRVAAELDTPEHLRKIVDEIIPQIGDGFKTEDGELENREIFRKFLGHLLWLMEFREEYDAARQKKDIRESLKSVKPLYHRAAEYINDEIIWYRVAVFEQVRVFDEDAAIDTLKKGVENSPESVMLIVRHAFFKFISCYGKDEEDSKENLTKIQESVDHALISYADNGFEIKPLEWTNEAEKNLKERSMYDRNKCNNFISAVVRSILGLCDENEIENISKYRREPLMHFLTERIQAFPKKKRLWIQMIFHEKIYACDFRLLHEIACEKCPNDVSLRTLIQAKIRWHYKLYASAQRLFNIVNEDTKWKNFIADKCSQFHDKIKENRSYRYEEFKEIIELDPSDDGEVRRSYSLYWRSLSEDLKDEWLLGDHELVQEVLAKAVLDCPEKKKFWSMKVQIETKLGKLDQLAKTFENAIKSVNSCDAIDFYLKFAEFEERRGNLLKAENVLELGLSRTEKDFCKVPLWIARIHLKLRMNNKTEAQTLLTQAMKKYPTSGKLWAEAISMEERSEKEKKAAEALEKCKDDKKEAKYVMFATAKYFFSRGEVEKSRKWLVETIELDYDFGNAWIYLHKLEKIYGTEESVREDLLCFILRAFEHNKCGVDDVQMYGEKWNAFKDHIDNWDLTPQELLQAIVKKENIDVKDI